MQYINRQFLVDAYQIPAVQGEIPQWLLRPQFALNMKSREEISFALVLNGETGKPTRVEIGEWVVNDRAE